MNNVRHQQHHHHHQQIQPGSHHLEDEEDDDVSAAGGGGREESIDNPHPHSQIRYDDAHSHSHALHNGGGASAINGVEGVVPHALYVPGSENAPAPAAGGGSDQLTLSFQGEVYVFDSVSPEKVGTRYSLLFNWY